MLLLPTELYEHILEYIKDLDDSDYTSETICSIALVSRFWLSAARKVIFRRINLDTKRRLVRFVEILDSSPMVGECVYELAVDGSHAGWERGDSSVIPLMRMGPLSPTLTKHLVNLRQLDFTSSRLQSWTTGDIDIVKQFSTITTLYVRESWDTMGKLQLLVSSFPRLNRLILYACHEQGRVSNDDEIVDAVIPFPATLQDLTIDYLEGLCSPGGFLNWISAANPASLIKVLRIRVGITEPCITMTTNLFKALHNSLEELELSIVSGTDEGRQ